MASRHQGRHKPRHHTHAVKRAHINRIPLPPLPSQTPDAASSTSTATPQTLEIPQNHNDSVSAEPVAAE